MSGLGKDVIEVGSKHVRERYILGAQVPLDNPSWKGPWDCAEFTSWCAYQAYGLVFGAGNPSKVSAAEPYSGYSFSEAKRSATVIPWRDALSVPGAALIREPASGRIGHVAFALGDGKRTLEARGAQFGVGIFDGSESRIWSIGCSLPGVDYEGAVAPSSMPQEPVVWPNGFMWLRRPTFKGGSVIALQRALLGWQIDPGPIDGEFGPMTSAGVVSFQVEAGIEVDGILGPQTARELGLGFPIPLSASDEDAHKVAHGSKGPPAIRITPTSDFDGVVEIVRKGKTYSAKTQGGDKFIIGTATTFTDDMTRIGLFQGSTAIRDSQRFGVYRASDHPQLGQWAHFIEPTLAAEGGARYAALNTYDRAAFTFGAPQLAAHTPNKNFIVYLRALLDLPDAELHFPELSLRANSSGNRVVHLKRGSSFVDLEQAEMVTRPNGQTDTQLLRLMTFLNASATDIDDTELSVAARLMNWLRLDPRSKQLQITVFVDQMIENLAAAKRKVPSFNGRDWRIALWIMDILHQGRGTYREIERALSSPAPELNLKRIGAASYGARIRTVGASVDQLAARGILDGFSL
ncbi:peptidoglycan-binding domain-containing protein [Xanthobacter versatilis]|uniref:peptidoglycan-binding domain-containing protein n=1 Tax=Xanthobacter autotrophicus (strain ATCC BAA-1158 / Py2) TaxID=78245 RepID=UPI00372C6D51